MKPESQTQMNFPCRGCGADQAPTFSVNQYGDVIECANCKAMRTNTHLDSEQCWCNPTLDYVNPDTGAEVWIHHQKH